MIRNKKLYIITTVSLKEKTEEDLKKEYEVCKIKNPIWQKKSYEDFCKFLKSWNWDKYDINKEDNSYFTDLEEAKNVVLNNLADLSDSGIYNYIVIKTVKLDKVYANVGINECYLFKYDKDKKTYGEVESDRDSETKYLSDYFYC